VGDNREGWAIPDRGGQYQTEVGNTRGGQYQRWAIAQRWAISEVGNTGQRWAIPDRGGQGRAIPGVGNTRDKQYRKMVV